MTSTDLNITHFADLLQFFSVLIYPNGHLMYQIVKNEQIQPEIPCHLHFEFPNSTWM